MASAYARFLFVLVSFCRVTHILPFSLPEYRYVALLPLYSIDKRPEMEALNIVAASADSGNLGPAVRANDNAVEVLLSPDL